MLSLIENNYILAAISSLIIVSIFYIDGRKNKERTFSTYVRYFLLSFLLILCILFYKTKNYSLPSMKTINNHGGSINSNINISRPSHINMPHNMDLLNIGEPEF